MNWKFAFWVNVLAAFINLIGALIHPNALSACLFFVTITTAAIIHVSGQLKKDGD
jgi:hypothetical protein